MSVSVKTQTLEYELNAALPDGLQKSKADPQWEEFRSVLNLVANGAVPVNFWTRFTIPGRAKLASVIAYQFRKVHYPDANWKFSVRVADKDTLYVTRIPASTNGKVA